MATKGLEKNKPKKVLMLLKKSASSNKFKKIKRRKLKEKKYLTDKGLKRKNKS